MIAQRKIVLEDEEIRQRDGEVIHRDFVMQMLFAVFHQALENGSRQFALIQLFERQALVEDAFGRLVVVVSRRRRLK